MNHQNYLQSCLCAWLSERIIAEQAYGGDLVWPSNMIAKLENFMVQFVARIAGILIQAFTLQDALNRIRGKEDIFFQRACYFRKAKHVTNIYLEDLQQTLLLASIHWGSACASVMWKVGVKWLAGVFWFFSAVDLTPRGWMPQLRCLYLLVYLFFCIWGLVSFRWSLVCFGLRLWVCRFFWGVRCSCSIGCWRSLSFRALPEAGRWCLGRSRRRPNFFMFSATSLVLNVTAV